MSISSSQITLFNSQLVVKTVESTSSPNGIKSLNGGYGLVVMVEAAVTIVVAGDFIGYRRQEFPVEISYGNESYLLIPDTDILYKELTPP